MKKELVKNWMSKDVITLKPDATLPEAHQLMMTEEIRRLPVVDDNGRLLGIVTLGDIRGAEPSAATNLSIWELNYLLANLTLAKIMTADPITIPVEASIGDAARIMLENRVSGLPVIDNNGTLIGIITESDIFSMVVVHEWNAEEDETAMP
ncbi:MAG: CBS domain-containing protein [Anaerolineales bacterium]|nr:CBS domain-containing protein [Anaerolineales bacterium]MCA9927705.1 CBS domain-containing protein [Anaerolineales bacterium]